MWAENETQVLDDISLLFFFCGGSVFSLTPDAVAWQDKAYISSICASYKFIGKMSYCITWPIGARIAQTAYIFGLTIKGEALCL